MSSLGIGSVGTVRPRRPLASVFLLLLGHLFLSHAAYSAGLFAEVWLLSRGNLILNSGFENATPEPFSSGATGGTLEPEFLEQHVHAGQFSVRHLATQNGSYTDPWFGSNPVAYNGDTTFRLSTWAKAANSGTRIRVYIFCLTKGNGASPDYYSSTLATIGTEWQEIRHTHICPADRDYATVRLDNLEFGNTVWWDDLELIQVPNAIEQPGFESGKLEGTFDRVSSGSLQIDGSDAYKGAYSLKHTATANDSYTLPYTGVGAALTPVAPGDQLTLSIWVKAATNTPVQMRIFCYDKSYASVGNKRKNFTATTSWQQLALTHSCPQGAQHAGLRLDNDGGAGSIVWWDEAIFERQRESVRFMAPRSERVYSSEVYDLGKIEHAADAAEFAFRLPDGATQLEITHVLGPVTASIEAGTGTMYYGAVSIDRPSWLENAAGASFDIQLEFQSSAGTFTFSLRGGMAGPAPSPTPGPLQADGGRHFTTPAGDAVYLAGAHTWNNFQSFGPRAELDYTAFLLDLEKHNHNLMRLWMWEGRRIGDDGPLPDERISPLPWCKVDSTGETDCYQPIPNASLKWDLYEGDLNLSALPDFETFYQNVRFNDAFFELLRNRVLEARARSIYVDVMPFQGFSVRETSSYDWDAWFFHPLAGSANNLEGIDGDIDGDGDGRDYHSLDLVTPDTTMEQAVTMFQRAYVRRISETLRDLDNVLFEIGNELDSSSKDWQYAMLNELRSLSDTHPLGMTAYGSNGPNSDYFGSSADWVSPGRRNNSCSSTISQDYSFDPPVNNQGKVVLSDSDHLGCILGTTDRNVLRQWIWKNVTRGVHTMLMGAYEERVFNIQGATTFDNATDPTNSTFAFAHAYIGAARSFAERLDLNVALPSDNSNECQTKYCLRQPGKAYLIYQPADQAFNVLLEPNDDGPVTYRIQWLKPRIPRLLGSQTLAEVLDANTFEGGTVDVLTMTNVTFGGSTYPRPSSFCSGSSQYRCDAVLLLTGTPLEAPAAPVNLTGTALATDQITLNWEAGSDGGDPEGYYVYRGLTSTSLQRIATITGLTTIYNDTDVQHSTTYRYEVAAFNAVGESPRSQQIIVRTPPPAATADVTLQNPYTRSPGVPSMHLFIAEVVNSGEEQLPFPVTIKWYYSTNMTFDPTDLELCWLWDPATGEQRCFEEEWVVLPGEVSRVYGLYNFYGQDLGPGGYILIVVDPHNQVVETDETNNVVVVPNFPIPTSHAYSPDLRPTRLISPLEMDPGDIVDMTITVENFGSVDAGASQAIIYLSPDNSDAIGPNPQESEMEILAEVTIGALPAGLTSETVVLGVTIPSGLAEGFWELGVKVDRNDSVAEADEANNFYREFQLIGEVP